MRDAKALALEVEARVETLMRDNERMAVALRDARPYLRHVFNDALKDRIDALLAGRET